MSTISTQVQTLTLPFAVPNFRRSFINLGAFES